MNKTTAAVLNLSLLLIAASGIRSQGAAVVGSLFDPDSYTALNAGSAFTLTSGNTLTLNTDDLSVSGPLSGTGAVDATAGGGTAQSIALFTFSSLTVDAGATISITGSRPFAILSQGGLTFNGVVDISGANGAGTGTGGTGVAGGGSGGSGQLAGVGLGGGGSGAADGGGVLTGGGGGASYAGSGLVGGGVGGGSPGSTYGVGGLTDLEAGSGGGAGGGGVGLLGNGAGAGGGAGIMIAQTLLSFGGTFDASGGDGSGTLVTGGGGGGSGGAFILAAPSISLAGGAISLNEGNGGDTAVVGGDGGRGGGGRLAYYYDGAGFSNPGGVTPTLGTGGAQFDNSGTDFPVALISAPEPSSTLLVIIGFAAILLRRRKISWIEG